MPKTTETTVAEALTEAINAQSEAIVAKLTVEQQAALESKFNALPEEVRSSIAAKYPAMSVVGMYIVRQMVKEANGKLASIERPKWYNTLEINAKSLTSLQENIRAYGEAQLRDLAEEIDSKESVSLVKKYKSQTDRTSKDVLIVQLCGIFGINPSLIA